MRSERFLFLLRGFVVAAASATLLIVSPQVGSAQQFKACGPPPDLKRALDTVLRNQPADQGAVAFRAAQTAKLEELSRHFPDNFYVERVVIDLNWFWTDRQKLIEKYKELVDRDPGDPRLLYLYGYASWGRNTPEAIKALDSALEKAPKFPWPHLALADIYAQHNFADKEKFASHLKAFLSLCPESFDSSWDDLTDGYRRVARLEDKEYVRQTAANLRGILSNRDDLDAVADYPTLWALEFKIRPSNEYDILRKQVGEDLNRIRALNLQDKREWYAALEEGYKRENDQKQADWAKNERQRLFPAAWEVPGLEQWRKDHPEPKPGDSADKKTEFYSEKLRQNHEWMKVRPNAMSLYWGQLDALGHLDDVPAAEVETDVEAALKAAEANAEPFGVDSDFLFMVAGLLSKKKLEPKRQLELAKNGLEQWAIESKLPDWDTWMDAKQAANQKFYRATNGDEGLALEADAYLELHQPDKARLTLEHFNERLQELNSLAGDDEGRKKEYASHESEYRYLMARLSEADNHPQDAMALYVDALLTRLSSDAMPKAGEKDELADNARKLWDKLGGTSAGWDLWYGKRAAAELAKSHLTWEAANDPLPGFEVADLEGKTWKLSDLGGKVVLLNFWATW